MDVLYGTDRRPPEAHDGISIFIWIVWQSLFQYVVWVVPLRQQWIAVNGLVTSGRVTGRRTVSGKGANYYITYAFTTPDDRLIECESEVASDAYERSFVGALATILYDPLRPRRSLPYEYSDFIVSEAAMR